MKYRKNRNILDTSYVSLKITRKMFHKDPILVWIFLGAEPETGLGCKLIPVNTGRRTGSWKREEKVANQDRVPSK